MTDSGSLTQYQHPADPRVIVSPNREIFEAVVSYPQYQAALIDIQNIFPEEMETLRSKKFRRYLFDTSPLSHPLGLKAISGVTIIGKDESRETTTIPLSLTSIFQKMARVHIALSPKEDAVLWIGNNLEQEKHCHDKAFLNLTILMTEDFEAPALAKEETKGTGWENSQGVKLYAEEFQLMYIGPDFEHLSPPSFQNGNLRFTIIATAPHVKTNSDCRILEL